MPLISGQNTFEIVGYSMILESHKENNLWIHMDDILDLTAVGSDYNVYNISSIEK